MVTKVATVKRLTLIPALGALLLLSMGSASAQMHKWVDAKGVTHYTSEPPPPNVKMGSIKAGASSPGATPLPYLVAQAVRNFPVTMYTTSPCPQCDKARAHLQKRGVPFTEKTVNTAADEAAARQNGSDGVFPMLLIGRNKFPGFDVDVINAALKNATYPDERILSANFSNTPAAPASGAQLPNAAPVATAAQKPVKPAPVPEPKPATAPTGFQF